MKTILFSGSVKELIPGEVFVHPGLTISDDKWQVIEVMKPADLFTIRVKTRHLQSGFVKTFTFGKEVIL